MRRLLVLMLLVTAPAFADIAAPDGWSRKDNVLLGPAEECFVVLSPERDLTRPFRAWFDAAMEKVGAGLRILQQSDIEQRKVGACDVITWRTMVVDAREKLSWRQYVAAHHGGKVQLLMYGAAREELFDRHLGGLRAVLDSWTVGGAGPVTAAALPSPSAAAPVDLEGLNEVQEVRLALLEAASLQQQGQYEPALRAFERCRARALALKARDEELSAMSSAQTCLVLLGRFEDAARLGNEVLNAARAPLVKARAQAALSRAYRGMLQYERSLRAARAALEAAGDYARDLPQRMRAVSTLDKKGAQDAVDLYHGAAEMRRLYLDAAWLLELLGRSEEVAALLQGDAWKAVDGALIDAAVMDALRKALGTLFAPTLADAFAEAYAAQSAFDAFEARVALGRAYAVLAQESRGDDLWARALAALKEAQALAERPPLQPVHRAAALLVLGESLLAQGQEADARAALEACLELVPRAPVVARTELEVEALAALVEAGDSALLARAQRLAKERAPLDSTLPWRLKNLEGTVLERQGRKAEAAEAYRAAVDLIERERGGIQTAELKAKFFRKRQRVYENLIRVLHQLDRDDEAMLAMERVRARALLDLLGAVRVRKGVSPGLQKRIEAERQAVVDANRRGTPIAAASRTFDDVLREAPELADLKGAAPLPPERVATLLDADTALLEYMVGEDDVSVILLRAGAKPRMLALAAKPAEVRRLVGELRSRVQNPRNDKWRGPAQALYEALVAPVEKDLEGARRLVVLPYDRLHHLPWAVLSCPDGSLLGDRHALVVLPSATVLGFCRARQRAPRTELAVFALGNVSRDGMAGLPGTLVEAESVKRLFPGARLVAGEKFTAASVPEAARGRGIVHFATHGVLDASVPEASAVVTADGRLPIQDIMELDLRADLVVLSACETGLGRVYSGDEVVGLTRAFMYAGTPSVMATLWKVSDDSTARFMAYYYEALRGADKSVALQAAQRRLREAYPHPFYWAPFLLMGDWR